MKTQEKLDLAESRYKALLKSMSSPESSVVSFNHNQINKAFARVRELKYDIYSEQTSEQKRTKWMEL